MSDGPAVAARSSQRPRRIAGPSKEAPAPELVQAGFAWEIADAPLLHHGLNLADIGHVLDLRARGLIPPEATAELLRVLLDAYHTSPEDFPYDAASGEVYNSRECHFVARIGDAAGWLHAGRPRREAARVALRLLLRSQTARLIDVGAEFASTSAEVAERHAETFMGDQTYLQQAQPSTFGHYLLAFVPPALRDGERFCAALEQINKSPGGAGCVNGSRLLQDRDTISRSLGFDGVITHTRDAMWQTDVFIDLLATSASMIANQAKLAEDLEIWSSQEFDYIELAGGFTRASVLMPQKRNPYSLSIIRGASGVIIGRLSGFLAVVKSPSARSDNLIFAYGEIPRALDFTTRVSALTTGVVRTMTVNTERMWSELLRGFAQATDLAEYVMVSAGVDYRSAYNIVGRAVRAASRQGLCGVDISTAMLENAATEVCGTSLGLDPEDLAKALHPRHIVATRKAAGGAAPGEVRSMARDFAEHATRLRKRAHSEQRRYKDSERALIEQATALASPE